MFTVLIAEKKHLDAIQQKNKLFFEPFLENKELAFCTWNPEGQDLYDSVPGLSETVGRRKEWRAVILNNTTEETVQRQNPFDVVDSHELVELVVPPRQLDENESWEVWEAQWLEYYRGLTQAKTEIYRRAMEQPLVKMATWLSFRPQDFLLNEVQGQKDAQDWALEMIGRDERKPSAKLEQLEREQYKWETRTKERIRREFSGGKILNIAYPQQIHCITTRTAGNSFFDPDQFWNIRQESQYSSFAERNMFFDNMRFMVFDLLSQSHRNFRNDYIRFLAAVLVFSANEVSGSAMQARRLYRLEVETDDTPLCTLVTSYDKKLKSTWDVVENEIEKIRDEIPGELSDKEAQAMFCSPQDVQVPPISNDDCEQLYAGTNYGLCFDSPEREDQKWARDRQASEKLLAHIVKVQARVLRKCVEQVHISEEVPKADISRLTPYQIDDIREYTEAAERDMIASTPPDLTDMSRFQPRLDRSAERVQKIISRRMTQKTVLCLLLMSLGAYLLCFLPFLFSNNGTSKTVLVAIILSGATLAVLAAVMVISLLVMRASLKKAIANYNDTVQEVVAEIRASNEQYSHYLSAACNVRRGYSVQRYAAKNVDEYTQSLRIRRKHQEDIRRQRAYLAEEYKDYLADSSYCDETMVNPYDYDFGQRTEYAYPAPFMAGASRQIEFVTGGNYATTPLGYVTSILIRMEGIYDE